MLSIFNISGRTDTIVTEDTISLEESKLVNISNDDIPRPSESDVRKSMAVRRWLLILAAPVILFYTVFWFDRFRILAEKNIEIDGKRATVQIRKHHANVFVRILNPGGETSIKFPGDVERQLSNGEKAEIRFDEKNLIIICKIGNCRMKFRWKNGRFSQ